MHDPGIYPSVLPQEIIDDPRRGAERIVYEKLSTQLEGFTVIYHCPWLDDETGLIPSDGETDFIVAHPRWGFITLEVKGGIISRDLDTRIWKSTNKLGRVFKIKNPIEQALKSKHVVLRKIKKIWHGSAPFIRAKHGVIFPDSGRPRGTNSLGADMPLDIFAFAEDVDSLGARVLQILMHEPDGSETKYDKFGEQGIDALHDLFGKGFNLDVSLASRLDADDKIIEELTEQQKQFLDLTVYQKRLVVTGGAGTGKTTLAIEKARRLAEEGKKVLLLCFNSPLASYLLDLLAEHDAISVFSFHKFCAFAAKEAGISVPNAGDDQRYFEQSLPDALLDALSAVEDLRYDAIIVDEGQDFLSQWWEPLLLSLRDNEVGLFYVFRDDNQQLYRDRSETVPDMPEAPLHLPTNLRNTKSIFKATKAFYSGAPLNAGGPDGKDLEWLISPIGKECRTVEKAINKLVNLEGIPKKDIAVLSASSLQKSVFGKDRAIGQYQTKAAEDIHQDLITLDTVYRYKGLESKVVILTDLDKSLDTKEVLYVGFARAKVLLLLVATEPTIAKLKQAVKTSDAES